ncbi:MAG: hypothetical protein GC151_18850 [Betaproteobacteria bacterium]|nr:hypothetical protein [Betaproteobacteria bacterium]
MKLDLPAARVVPPIGSDVDPVVRLRESWGHAPFYHTNHWVDISNLDLELPALDRMLRRLPPEKVFVRTPGTDPDFGSIPRIPFGPEPLAEQLAARSLHVVVLSLEDHDPGFAAALDAFMARIAPALAGPGREVIMATTGIFLASGRSVVPFHVDLEHNFLMQVYGSKQLNVFPNDDQEILPEIAREHASRYTGEGRFLKYRPEFEERGQGFQLGPGMSGYQPAFCPHWVGNGDEVTLSVLFSVYTQAEFRKKLTHMANRTLRRLGVNPSHVGASPLADRIKYGTAVSLRKVVRKARATS